VFFDQVTAENNHSQADFGAFFVVGDRLLGKYSLMKAPHPRRANRSEDDMARQRRVADPQW
jgi:hypothetical protein